MNIGVMIVRDRMAIAPPIRVNFNAWCPCPFRRNECPGRLERKVSSVWAPRKIEGMKSRNV